jgi:hypothetical protein
MKIPAPKLTDDHRKLLYLVGIYANALDKSEDKEMWFKDGPLFAVIYELTAEGIFETYDYAPVSVLGLDGFHRFMNISVEGKDDLDDLRELGLLSHMKISTTTYGTVTAYRLSDKGMKLYMEIPKKMREPIDKLVHCPKHKKELMEIICINFERYFFRCSKCKFEREITIFEIEDVSYVSQPRFIKLPYRKHK